MLMRRKICDQNPVLHLAHVLAEAVAMFESRVKGGRNLADVVCGNVGRAKRPMPT